MQNSEQQITDILNILKCDNVLRYGALKRYQDKDINDKKVQSDMLDFDAKLFVAIDMYATQKVLKSILRDCRFAIYYKPRHLKIFIKEHDKVTKLINDFIKKYSSFIPDQHNVQLYKDDSTELEKGIHDYLNYKKSTNILNAHNIYNND